MVAALPTVVGMVSKQESMYIPDSSVGKEFACNVGDLGSIPGLGRSAGEGKGYPLSILAWRIPRTVESMGLQRVGHD